MSDLGSDLQEDEIVDLHPEPDISDDDGWGTNEVVDLASTSPPGAHEPSDGDSVASDADLDEEPPIATDLPRQSATEPDDTDGDGWGDAPPDAPMDQSHENGSLPLGGEVALGGEDLVAESVEDAGEPPPGDLPEDDGWGEDVGEVPEAVEGEVAESVSDSDVAEEGREASTADLDEDLPSNAADQAAAEDNARREVEQAIQERGDSPSIDDLLRDIDDHAVPIDWQDIDMRSDSDSIVLADDVPNAMEVPPEMEYFHLITHGSAEGLQADIDGSRIDLNVEQTAAMIEANPDWNGRPVRVFGCSAGAGDFPEKLAARLNVEIVSATAIVDLADPTAVTVGKPGRPGYWKHSQPMRQ